MCVYIYIYKHLSLYTYMCIYIYIYMYLYIGRMRYGRSPTSGFRQLQSRVRSSLRIAGGPWRSWTRFWYSLFEIEALESHVRKSWARECPYVRSAQVRAQDDRAQCLNTGVPYKRSLLVFKQPSQATGWASPHLQPKEGAYSGIVNTQILSTKVAVRTVPRLPRPSSGKGQMGSALVSANGVTARFRFFDRGTFWVLLLTCFYLPKSARAYLFPQSDKQILLLQRPHSVDPICPQPRCVYAGQCMTTLAPAFPRSGPNITHQKSQKWNSIGMFQKTSTGKVTLLWTIPSKSNGKCHWFLVCNRLPLQEPTFFEGARSGPGKRSLPGGPCR